MATDTIAASLGHQRLAGAANCLINCSTLDGGKFGTGSVK